MLLLTVVLLTMSTQTHAQSISFSGKAVPLKKVFAAIEKQTGYVFFYDGPMLQDAKPVTVQAEGMALKDFLGLVLSGQPVEYVIRNKTIFLSRRATPAVPSPAAVQDTHVPVTGLVKNEREEVLSGASVENARSHQVVVADQYGRFTIQAAEGDQLLFLSLGYLPLSQQVKGTHALQVVLTEEIKKLEEVVVIGYGTQVRKNVTGAIAKVDMKKTETLPNNNVFQALRGRVAGVQFLDGARPGQNGSVLIRGPKSLSGGNNPLIVLDGIIYNGSVADIPQSDIESMEVLKDASAAAIYGSRAANGVILITSKRGKSEIPEVRINAYTGFSDWSYVPKLLSPERYIQRILDYRMQAGLPSDPAQVTSYLGTSEVENYLAKMPIDPWKEASQDGRLRSADLNISGKSKRIDYSFSGSYAQENGLIYNDNWKRLVFRAAVENKVKDWLKIGFNATYTNRDASGYNNTAELRYVVVASPYGTWYHEDGQPTQFPVVEENAASNPIRQAKLSDNQLLLNNLFANFYAVIDFPFLKGLSYRMNVAPNYRWNVENNVFRQDKHLVQNTKYANKWNQRITDNLFENILTYTRQINKDHYADLTLLYGTNRQYSDETRAASNLLSTDVLGWNNLGLGEIFTNSSAASEVKGRSSMARLNYRLKDKYFLTLTARRDGSSVFAENNKYAILPSGALAWVISDEPFLAKQSVINMLKLRLSYGAVGNQALSPYQSLSLTDKTQYTFADRLTAQGLYTSGMANSDLKWETTYTLNMGADFELFKGRINGAIDLYNMNTRDLLVRRAIPTMTGFSSVMTNIGATNNKGIEISLSTVNITGKEFEWSSDLVFSRNINKIVHLYRTDSDGDGKEDNDIGNGWFIGQPVNVAYNYVFDGIYQEGDNMPAGYKPGFVRLKDMTDDKIVDAKDRVVLGQTGEPKFRYGITNKLRYQQLTLSFFVNVAQGWIGNFTEMSPISSAAGRSLNKIDAGWWTAENKSNTMPSLVYNNPLGHGYYLSRSFVRLQDVSLVYSFPRLLCDKMKLTSARLYASAKNVFTITDWLGPDPESGRTSAADLYPRSRSFTLGCSIGF
jgi:TonB-linked SusC/RagA family outer membrane protein